MEISSLYNALCWSIDFNGKSTRPRESRSLYVHIYIFVQLFLKAIFCTRTNQIQGPIKYKHVLNWSIYL